MAEQNLLPFQPCAGGTTKVNCDFNLWAFYVWSCPFCRNCQQWLPTVMGETGVHAELSWEHGFISLEALSHLQLPAAFIFFQHKPGWTKNPQGRITNHHSTKPSNLESHGLVCSPRLCISHIDLIFPLACGLSIIFCSS